MTDEELNEAQRLFSEADIVLIDTRNEGPRASPLPSSLRDLKRKTKRR